MAIITKASTARVAVVDGVAKVSHLFAGEDLAACVPVVINSAGAVVTAGSSIASTNHEVSIYGWVGKSYLSGQPVTIFVGAGVRLGGYSTGMTPGTQLYIAGGSPLGLMDTSASSAKLFTLGSASTGSTVIIDNPACFVVSAADIVTLR